MNNAYNHLQLGDAYFQRANFIEAEECYQAALKHDPKDMDTRSRLGQCLLRLGRYAEARPLLEDACRNNPKHDYGHTLMALAETLSALGESEAAFNAWKRITASYAYPRARVQLAEIYLARNQSALARAELKDVARADLRAPIIQRRRDRQWVRRAKTVMRKLS